MIHNFLCTCDIEEYRLNMRVLRTLYTNRLLVKGASLIAMREMVADLYTSLFGKRMVDGHNTQSTMAQWVFISLMILIMWYSRISHTICTSTTVKVVVISMKT